MRLNCTTSKNNSFPGLGAKSGNCSGLCSAIGVALTNITEPTIKEIVNLEQ